MKLRLLGPLTIQGEGPPVVMRGGRLPAVLALLVLNARTVAPVERIIDAVWGEVPPATVRTQVHAQISALRRLLRDVGGAEIYTLPAGYLLSVDPGEVDVFVFEERVRHARALAARGRTADAVTALEAALALWRGPALGGVDAPFARLEVARLEEQRLAALAERVALELELGRHRELVPELTALVAEHPLREMLRRHLMVALLQDGRRADAFTVYDKGRRLLRDELGLDPGPELTAAYRAILGDVPAARPTTVAHDVPTPPPDFVGREEHLALALHYLEESAREGITLVITGGPGVGKSAFAARLVSVARSRFPDVLLYARLRDGAGRPVPHGMVLVRFLRALGVPAAALRGQAEELAQTYRARLTARRALVVLDDAVDECQVRPLLPGTVGCATLITSRNTLAGLEGARWLRLGAFRPGEAIELLVRVAGPERVAANLTAAAAIGQYCGRLPLAIRIVGARLAIQPGLGLATLARRLARQAGRLDELAVGDLSARTALAYGNERLDVPLRRAYQLLAWSLPAAFPEWAAMPVLDGTQAMVERVLVRLFNLNLVEANGPGTYRFPTLLHLYGREQAAVERSDVERVAALRRLLSAVICLAERAEVGLGQHRRSPVRPRPALCWTPPPELVARQLADARGWLESARPLIAHAVRRAAATDAADLAAVAAAYSAPPRVSPHQPRGRNPHRRTETRPESPPAHRNTAGPRPARPKGVYLATRSCQARQLHSSAAGTREGREPGSIALPGSRERSVTVPVTALLPIWGKLIALRRRQSSRSPAEHAVGEHAATGRGSPP